MNPETYLTGEGVATLWAAVQTALGKKLDAEALGDAAKITFQPVDALPETGEPGVIYLAPGGEGGVRKQYLWNDGAWAPLGDAAPEIAGLWSKDELRAMTAEELQAILV